MIALSSFFAWLAAAYLCVVSLYLLALSLAALFFRKTVASGQPPLRLAVVIPAHNEEGLITSTIAHLRQNDFPRDCLRLFVVADNCDDGTVARAREAGAVVLERKEALPRGKGAALHWFFENHAALCDDYQGIVVLDADSSVEPGFLREISASLSHPGVRVVQAYNGARNQSESWLTGISTVALAVANDLRQAGRAALVGSASLKGNGMAFRTEILRKYGWPAHSVVEDAEFSFILLMDGVRIHYNPDAHALSEMSSSVGQATSQRIRWDSARVHLFKTFAGKTLRQLFARRELRYLDAFMEIVTLPFSLLVLGQLAVLAVALLIRDTALIFAMLGCLLATAFTVTSALVVRKAPLRVWLSLFAIPIFLLWKLFIWINIASGKDKGEWKRTPRNSERKVGMWLLPVAALGALFHSAGAHATAPAGRARLGINLSQVNDWSRELPFVDLFKSSRPWMEKNPGELTLDGAGFPLLKKGQKAETLMARDLDGHYPRGVYTITFKGKGLVTFPGWDKLEVRKFRKGRIELFLIPGNEGLSLVISESSPKDPVRDVHVWLPGFKEGSPPFHPRFLAGVKPFGTIRFMDWQRTNESTIVKWDDRPKPSDARYTLEKGVPLELMIELANRTGASPWFCLPHLADDDYVRHFASLVKERLDPSLKVYIEYSNEVWNWRFPQAAWARDEGRKRKLGDPEHLRFYSMRSVEIFHIWEDVFGGTGRLVRVLSSQFVSPWASEQVLSWKEAWKKADALAVAPYFGNELGDPKKAEQVAALEPDQVLDALETEITTSGRDEMKAQAAIARKYHVKLLAYEGGQHLAGYNGAENNDALTRLFIAANRSPRMGSLYRKSLDEWFAAGGELYVAFNDVGKPSKWGSWGLSEYFDEPKAAAPKLGAILDYISTSPALPPAHSSPPKSSP